MEFHHKPVLFHETIEALAIQPEGIYIDGTMGGGGHSEAILQRLTTGKLLSIDQDPDAMRAAGERLASYPQSIRVQGNFAQMRQLAESRGIQRANGVLLDIGVSSYQLDTPERGFSYHYDAPLDMRMSQEGPSAKDLVNSLSEEFEGMRDRDQNALYAFDGDIALYNYYTSSYDNMESGKMSFDADELTAYLSPGNSITVRYIPKESTSSDAAVFLPIPAITGEKL